MIRLAVFASGNGSNFQALAEAASEGQLQAQIALLFCDQPAAFALQRAEAFKIPTLTLSPKDFATKQLFETQLIKELAAANIDLIILAGYMRIIGPTMLAAYPNKIINIHPALLPAFPGAHGIEDAFAAGVSETGVTIHYVDSGVDTGPIIAQQAVSIAAEDTLETLATKIHQVEHELYPKTVQLLIEKLEKGRR